MNPYPIFFKLLVFVPKSRAENRWIFFLLLFTRGDLFAFLHETTGHYIYLKK